MTDTTLRLALPLIAAAQAQKHVTHNEALLALDALVHLCAIDRNRTAPTASPAEGDRHVVAQNATGAWAGRDGNLAIFEAGSWRFMPPAAGWLAWLKVEKRLIAHDGTGWSEVNAANLTMLGINATPDQTTRLAIASAASLFNHAGTDHRMTINRKTAANTASQIFSTDFSARAEIGLTGGDAFEIKVSPNGTNFQSALAADFSGVVRYPAKPASACAMTGALSPALAQASWIPINSTQTSWSETLAQPVSSFTPATGRFRATAAGLFRLECSATFYTGPNPSHVYLSLWRNGSLLPGTQQAATVTGAQSFGSLHTMAVALLAKDDDIEARVYVSAAGVALLNGGFGGFSAEFLG